MYIYNIYIYIYINYMYIYIYNFAVLNKMFRDQDLQLDYGAQLVSCYQVSVILKYCIVINWVISNKISLKQSGT